MAASYVTVCSVLVVFMFITMTAGQTTTAKVTTTTAAPTATTTAMHTTTTTTAAPTTTAIVTRVPTTTLPPVATLEVSLNVDFDSFTLTKKTDFINAMLQVLRDNKQDTEGIMVTFRRGSVIAVITFPNTRNTLAATAQLTIVATVLAANKDSPVFQSFGISQVAISVGGVVVPGLTFIKGSKDDVAVGVGLGVGIGGLYLLIIIVYFLFFRKHHHHTETQDQEMTNEPTSEANQEQV